MKQQSASLSELEHANLDLKKTPTLSRFDEGLWFEGWCFLQRSGKPLHPHAIDSCGAFLAVAMSEADDAAPIYKTKCAMCHGPDGKGDTPAGKAMKVQDLASEDVQKMSDSDLGTVISSGKGKMPSYKTLTPDQVKDLVGFVRSLGKKK